MYSYYNTVELYSVLEEFSPPSFTIFYVGLEMAVRQQIFTIVLQFAMLPKEGVLNNMQSYKTAMLDHNMTYVVKIKKCFPFATSFFVRVHARTFYITRLGV